MRRFDRERMVQIQALLERIDAALIVRDPGTVKSAEAFDGLRRGVAYAAKARRSHVAHLLSLDESLRTGGNLNLVTARVSEYLKELGVERFLDVTLVEAFDIGGDPSGTIEVIEPAIIEREEDGRITVLRVGKALRTAIPEPQQTAPEDVEKSHDSEEQNDTISPSNNDSISVGAQLLQPNADQIEISEMADAPRKAKTPDEQGDPEDGEDIEKTEPDQDEPRKSKNLHTRRKSPQMTSLVVLSIIMAVVLALSLKTCSADSDSPGQQPDIEVPATTTTIQ